MRHAIRPALAEDLAALPAIESASDSLFAVHGLGPLPPGVSTVDELDQAAYVLVAGSPAVGFARLEVVDGQSHLEQLSVHPDAARRGLGRLLLEGAAAWAAGHGHTWLTLCTFADVPWNAPFYLRHGFEATTDLGPELRALRETERHLGLDDIGRRVVLRRKIAGSAEPRGQRD